MLLPWKILFNLLFSKLDHLCLLLYFIPSHLSELHTQYLSYCADYILLFLFECIPSSLCEGFTGQAGIQQGTLHKQSVCTISIEYIYPFPFVMSLQSLFFGSHLNYLLKKSQRIFAIDPQVDITLMEDNY